MTKPTESVDLSLDSLRVIGKVIGREIKAPAPPFFFFETWKQLYFIRSKNTLFSYMQPLPGL